jgi:hypothetical protein
MAFREHSRSDWAPGHGAAMPLRNQGGASETSRIMQRGSRIGAGTEQRWVGASRLDDGSTPGKTLAARGDEEK